MHLSLDPHQFAYKKGRNTEDAILLMLHKLYHHLDTPKNYARILFIDFSSAFNTIQPHLMIQKLSSLNVSQRIQAWVMQSLINCPQYVKIEEYNSQTKEISTGAPQGCVLSPVLYTLYTNDIQSPAIGTVPVIKYADDTAIVGLISSDENLYHRTISEFNTWCGQNYLLLNISKTKEMIIDFRKEAHRLTVLKINNEEIDQVSQYKYLGVTINDKLSWSDHCQSLSKKTHQRLFCLRKLKTFQIEKTIMNLFYSATVSSIITFAMTCWYGNATKLNRCRIDRLIKNASRTVQVQLPTLEELFKSRCLSMLNKILQDNTHPLHDNYILSSRSGRLLSIKARTERFKNSFLPLSVRICHQNCKSVR